MPELLIAPVTMTGIRNIAALLTVFVHLGMIAAESRIAHSHPAPYRFHDIPVLTEHDCGDREHHRPVDGSHQCPACVRSFTLFTAVQMASLLPLMPAVALATPKIVRIAPADHTCPDSPRAPPLALS